MLLLQPDRPMPIAFAPVVHRFQRSGEAAFCRDLTNDIVSLSRPFPQMGEAKKIECRVRIMPLRALPPEVHVARLGFIERKPIPTKTFSQNGKHAPAAVVVFKRQHKVVGVAHQLARTAQQRFHLLLKPLVQQVVQEHIGEQ